MKMSPFRQIVVYLCARSGQYYYYYCTTITVKLLRGVNVVCFEFEIVMFSQGQNVNVRRERGKSRERAM